MRRHLDGHFGVQFVSPLGFLSKQDDVEPRGVSERRNLTQEFGDFLLPGKLGLGSPKRRFHLGRRRGEVAAGVQCLLKSGPLAAELFGLLARPGNVAGGRQVEPERVHAEDQRHRQGVAERAAPLDQFPQFTNEIVHD